MKDEATAEQLAMARRVAAQHLDGCGGPHWANPSQDILDGRKDDIGLVQIALAAIIETTAQVERLEIVLPGFGAGLADGASIAKRQIVAHLKGQDHG